MSSSIQPTTSGVNKGGELKIMAIFFGRFPFLVEKYYEGNKIIEFAELNIFSLFKRNLWHSNSFQNQISCSNYSEFEAVEFVVLTNWMNAEGIEYQK